MRGSIVASVNFAVEAVKALAFEFGIIASLPSIGLVQFHVVHSLISFFSDVLVPFYLVFHRIKLI